MMSNVAGARVLMLVLLTAASFLPVANAADALELPSIQRMIASGDFEQARGALDRSLRAHPKNAALWNLRGVLEASQEHPLPAEQAFSEAVRLDPKLLPAWLNLGRLFATSGESRDEIKKGLHAYTEALRLDPSNAEAHHQSALLLEWKGAFAQSLEHLDSLPEADRNRLGALAIRCADLAALGRATEAMKMAEKLLDDPDISAADVLAIAPTLGAHNPEIETKLLEGLDAKGRGTAESAAELGAVLENRGDLVPARRVLETACASYSPSVFLLSSLARVAWKQKDYEGALGYLAHARDLDPEDASLHFLFGLAANELHLPLEARKSLERAVELAPDHPFYNFALGAVRLQWKETDGALPYLVKYAAARPQDPRGHLALAYGYFTLNRDEDTRRELAWFRTHRETLPGAEYLSGLLAAKSGTEGEAIAHFRAAIAADPGSADCRAQLGSVLLDAGQTAEARRETEAALAINRDHYVANRTLMRLYREGGDPRLAEQAARLKTLSEQNDDKLRLLQRIVELRPW